MKKDKEIDEVIDSVFSSNPTVENVRSYNVGNSDYSKHKTQPWDIWVEYHLNPFDADIVKRVLRKKKENGISEKDARIMDYKKIIHICNERINQLETGNCWEVE